MATSVSHVTETLCLSLVHRARQLLDELAATQHSFTEAPSTRTHGAFAFAVAQCRQLLHLIDSVRARAQQDRRDGPPSGVTPQRGGGEEGAAAAAAATAAEAARADTVSPATLLQLEKMRLAFRKALPRAVATLEETSVAAAGGGSAAAADAAASLRSLLHTRKMLSVELQKVEAARQQLSGAAETLGAVHQSLDDVHGAMEHAQRVVKRLLTVQNKEDLVLRISAACFALVVGYVLLQRVFGFFAVTVYVDLDE